MLLSKIAAIVMLAGLAACVPASRSPDMEPPAYCATPDTFYPPLSDAGPTTRTGDAWPMLANNYPSECYPYDTTNTH
jgi:hypothetical protein